MADWRQMIRLIAVTPALALAGCAAVITPPASPGQPLPVLVVDHGRHTSLVLPDGADGAVRYAYGDWRYYAEGERGMRAAFAALFRGTPAALGRRELAGQADPERVVAQLRVKVERVHLVHVETAAVERLRARLDAAFAAGAGARLYNSLMDLEFVPYPVPYTYRHNSNHVVAEWLVELGCEVSRYPMLAKWRIAAGVDR
jgi:hypothetical protein